MEMLHIQLKQFQLNKWSPVFLKRFSFFHITSFKVIVLKTFEISSDCHIKICQSLKAGYFKNP